MSDAASSAITLASVPTRRPLSAARIAYRVVSAATMAFVVAAALLAVSHLMGLRYYVVVSGSMTPSMPTGSLCVALESYPYNQVTAGDIVAFRTETGDITTHRVSAVTARGLVTKGDANDEADAAVVTRMGYAGRVVWHAAGLGFAVETLLSPVGLGIVVVAALSLLVAELALKRVADIEACGTSQPERLEHDDAAMRAVVAQAAAEAVRAALTGYLEADAGTIALGGSSGWAPDENGERIEDCLLEWDTSSSEDGERRA